MSDVKLLKYRSTDVPRQSGELGRLRILKGVEVGATFVLKSSSITIGRGDEVNLMIGDLKASRTHARLDFTHDGWTMSDLGSANGIFFQGEYIRKFNLKSGEHFTIGETIFEFLVSSDMSRLLTAPFRDGLEVERQDMQLAQQKIRVQNLAHGAKAITVEQKKFNPRTLLLALGVAGVYFYMNQGDFISKAPQTAKSTASAKKEKAAEEDRALASYLPANVGKDVQKTAEQYYWLGFREYTKGNYLRAKDNFELALQVNPSHESARHYLASAEKENEDEIKRLIAGARKAKLIGRMQDAKGDCAMALRHLYNDRANPDYADCAEIIKEINGGAQP